MKAISCLRRPFLVAILIAWNLVNAVSLIGLGEAAFATCFVASLGFGGLASLIVRSSGPLIDVLYESGSNCSDEQIRCGLLRGGIFLLALSAIPAVLYVVYASNS